ncbi:hypothetical protein ACVWZ6_007177 [Bradyrhizobium sp. GM6.1]
MGRTYKQLSLTIDARLPAFRPMAARSSAKSIDTAPSAPSPTDPSRGSRSPIVAAGLDEAAFSGHSMRAGFITSSLDNRVDPLAGQK